MRLVALRDADPARAENGERRRSGQGKAAVRAVDEAGPFHDRAGEHARFAEQFERDARADDINNGIHRADFMEVHFVGRQAVDFSFGDGDAVKDGDRFLLHAVRKRAALNQLFDLREIPSVYMVKIARIVVDVMSVIFHELRFAFLGAAAQLQSEHRGELVRFGQFFGRLEAVALPLELKELSFFPRTDRFQADAPGRDGR